MTKASSEANKLWPYLLPKVERVARGTAGSGGSAGIGGAPTPHALDSVHHSGALSSSQAPQFLLRDGTRSITGHLSVDTGITIDGVDLSAHVADPDAHHAKVHDITGITHTITGSALQLVGATATDTLGLLTPSSNPGAAAAILCTDANGSLFLDTNLLYVDAVNNRLSINQVSDSAALDVIVSANADHTLRVKQKSGQTGRLWRVEDIGGNELIVLDSQGNLQSGNPGFVSGLTGWQITYNGNAEFNNIWARGELHATVFVKDEVHATGGTMMVATAGKLYSDAVIDSTTVDEDAWIVQSNEVGFGSDWDVQSNVGGFGTEWTYQIILNYIEIDDPPSGPGFYFQQFDIVRSKTEVPTGITDFWFEIVDAMQFDGYSRYSVIKHSGTDGTLPAGAAVVSYGVEGDGRILLTSDLNYAPYMDVFTVGPEVWTGNAGAIVPHVRIGRLDGVGVTATSGIEQYGMIAGTDLSNANSPYIVASNLQLRLHKVDLTLNNGTNDTGEWDTDGNLTIGSNIGTDAGKTFQVITTGANAGDMIAGQLTSNYIQWDHSESTLLIQGSFLLGGDISNSLTVGENGYINSSNLEDLANTSLLTLSGFWLGWHEDAHKFFVGGGDSTHANALYFDPGQITIYTDTGIGIFSAVDNVISFARPLGVPHALSFTAGEVLSWENAFSAQSLISRGDVVRVETNKTPASGTATGTMGDICWDTNYIYVAVDTNSWKRAALSSF